jgi:YbbR domain-containing protein
MQPQKKHRSVFKLMKHSWRNRPSIKGLLIPFAKNWKIRIAALAIAFVCWGIVKTMEKTITAISVPLELETAENYEAFAQTINGTPIQKITLNILCSKREKNALRPIDYKGKIDLTSEIENVIPSYELKAEENFIYKGPAGNKDQYFIKSMVPSKIRITIDKRTYKSLPVKVVVTGKPADGYVVSKISVEPPVIDVNGPSTTIDKITELKTKIINIDGLNKTLPKDVELEPVDPGIVLETSKVKITIGINTSPKKRTFEHIKVKTLVSPPSENFYLLDPPDVKVLLEGREQIIETTMPKDITAYVDLENATAGYSLLIKVIPPANCNVVSVMPSTVTVKDNILQGTK